MKRYESLGDILISPEYKAFVAKSETTGFSILDKIVKKKGLKIKPIINLNRNIVVSANEFYNSPENEL